MGRSFRAAAAAAAAVATANAACAPMQNFINFAEDASKMMVGWGTACAADSTVAYGTTPALGTTVKGAATQYTGTGGYTSPFLHHATLTGLTPATLYYYQVGGGASGTSPVLNFTSQPGPGLTGAPMTLAVIGDLGQTANSADTLAHVLQNPDIVAVMHVGDLSYADSDEPRWDSWQTLVAPAAARLPWNVQMGNHEVESGLDTPTTAFTSRFFVPQTGGTRQLYYSVAFGGVTWVMMAGYGTSYAAGSDQYKWVQATLAAVDRSVTPWLFVSVHQPWMSSNTAHAGEGVPVQQVYEPLFHSAGVDAVFAGHVHAYERCYRSFNNKVDPTGSHYFTIGDGGNREGLATKWVSPQPAWSAFRQASYGHGELTIINATHTSWTWHQNPDLEPTIADSIMIVKGGSAEVGGSVTGVPTFRAGRGNGAPSADLPLTHGSLRATSA